MYDASRVLVLLLALAGFATAGEITVDFDMPGSGYQMTAFEGGDYVYWPDGVSCMDEGRPDLPGTSFCFVIPQGTTVTSADVEILGESAVDGSYDILPVRVVPVGATPGPFQRDPSVYMDNQFFPGSPVLDIRNGNRTGFRLASVDFTPFRYDPVSGELQVITSAHITLTYEDDPSVPRLALTSAQIDHAQQILANIVRNPESLSSCRPARREGGTDWASWVAIGSSAQQSVIQPLVDHRNATGMSAEYVTTESIYSTYSGYDTQEKIRNYLVDAFNNHGLMYALIIGDWGSTQRISSLYAGGMTLNETADLYYSDLDGTWDGDGDHLYGENTDGLDYYSDISVGRFSSNVNGQLTTMVDKTILYETASESGAWRTSALLCGAALWPEYGYYGSFVCDSISKYIPPSWTQYKLYETPGGYHPTNQIDIINSGVSYVSPQGHGYSSGIYWYNNPTNMITNSNYTSMTNWGKFPVFHSIACLAGQLSVNGCIAERLMFWTNGGAVAVMFNSNDGFGAPPSMGPSEFLEVHFARQLWQYDIPRLGDTQAAAKDAFQAGPGMSMKNWVLQENNMLGDPAALFIEYQTGIEGGDTPGAISSPMLSPAWPNPTSGAFSISWALPSPAPVSLGVFDEAGRLVRSVSQPTAQAMGTVAFDGLDSSGSPLSPGLYFVRLSSGAGTAGASVVVLAR